MNRCLITEDKESDIAKTMANVIAVKSGKEDSPKTSVLCEALRQPNIAEFIKNKFSDSVIYLAN